MKSLLLTFIFSVLIGSSVAQDRAEALKLIRKFQAAVFSGSDYSAVEPIVSPNVVSITYNEGWATTGYLDDLMMAFSEMEEGVSFTAHDNLAFAGVGNVALATHSITINDQGEVVEGEVQYILGRQDNRWYVIGFSIMPHIEEEHLYRLVWEDEVNYKFRKNAEQNPEKLIELWTESFFTEGDTTAIKATMTSSAVLYSLAAGDLTESVGRAIYKGVEPGHLEASGLEIDISQAAQVLDAKNAASSIQAVRVSDGQQKFPMVIIAQMAKVGGRYYITHFFQAVDIAGYLIPPMEGYNNGPPVREGAPRD